MLLQEIKTGFTASKSGRQVPLQEIILWRGRKITRDLALQILDWGQDIKVALREFKIWHAGISPRCRTAVSGFIAHIVAGLPWQSAKA